MRLTTPLLLVLLIPLCLTQPLHALPADTTCGIIWDEPIVLSDTNYNARSPKIALSGEDTVHVVWENASGTIRLPYARSTSGGLWFENRRELLPDSLTYPGKAFTPYVVACSSIVYLFFTGVTASYAPVKMLRSTSAGTQWDNVVHVSLDSAGLLFSAAMYGDSIGLVYPPRSDENKILRSTNGGQSWTRTNEDLNYFARIALSAGGVLHLVQIASNETQYRRSHDLGDSWVQTEFISTIDQYDSGDPTIEAQDSLVIAAWGDTKYGCLGSLGCSIISRKGKAQADSTCWEIEHTVTETPRGFAASAAISSGRFAVGWVNELSFSTFHAAVRLTNERDTIWCPVVDLTPTTPHKVIIVDVALSRKAVHVVWEQNVAPDPSTFRIFYRRGLFQTVGVKHDPPSTPELVHLQQNYPNPFNPTTSIRYALEKRMFVTIKVYDMLGRDITTLVQEQQEPGEHTVRWDAAGVPSGVYFYRLFAGEKIETKKAILIR